MIHGDMCFLPDAARRHIAAVPATTETKRFGTIRRICLITIYDQSKVLDQAATEVVAWFRKA